MGEECVDMVNSIKQEIDFGEDSSNGYHRDTPRSWDSGVALDSVTALQMAEFQAVVDNLHRQVIQPTPQQQQQQQQQQQPPPPYPFKFSLNDGGVSSELSSADVDQLFMFPSHTYQPSTQHKYETQTMKQGCQSLPANPGVIIQNKIVEKVENKFSANQRSQLLFCKICLFKYCFLRHLSMSIISPEHLQANTSPDMRNASKNCSFCTTDLKI